MANGKSTNRVLGLVKSDRGASFSIALLLMLICVALSAAVLAASTASAGRFADQGEMDQRYYAVTSAAKLFRDSLGADEEAVYEYTQQRENGAVTLFGGVKPVDPIKGYDFLTYITSLACFGGESFDSDGANWVEPFTRGIWKGFSAESTDTSYSIEPSSGLDDANIKVAVDARLHKNWLLELDFYNTTDKDGNELTNSAEDKAKKFHLYMSLEANEQPYLVDSGDEDEVEQRETKVTWKLWVPTGGASVPSAQTNSPGTEASPPVRTESARVWP